MSAAARRGPGEGWETALPPVVPEIGRAAKAQESKPKQEAPSNDEGAAVENAAENPAESTLKRRLLRLALDVHDGPMQNLAVIGFSLGDLRRRMEAVVPVEHHTNLNAGMETISEELVRVESELRALITALEHDGRTPVQLVDAIEGEIREFERRSVVKVEFTQEGEIRTNTDSQRIALQSVVRAALANVAKHAAANTVKIELHGDADSLTLVIEDDGRGFNANAKPKKGRFGVVGMRERVELLGGQFELESRSGGPTRITARLQLWQPPATQ
jgi:signal transduction histidine kinase